MAPVCQFEPKRPCRNRVRGASVGRSYHEPAAAQRGVGAGKPGIRATERFSGRSATHAGKTRSSPKPGGHLMQAAEFDLICLGSGPAGQKAAIQAAKAGFAPAIGALEPQVGGSCLLSGTIPSKALREQALRYRRMRGNATSLAVELRGDAPLSALLHGVDVVIAAQDKYLLAQLARNHVELIRGHGIFLDANCIEVQ